MYLVINYNCTLFVKYLITCNGTFQHVAAITDGQENKSPNQNDTPNTPQVRFKICI